MQHFVTSKLFKVIFTDFFAKKQKLRNSVFEKTNLIFSKKINIRSPGGEPAMVSRQVSNYASKFEHEHSFDLHTLKKSKSTELWHVLFQNIASSCLSIEHDIKHYGTLG